MNLEEFQKEMEIEDSKRNFRNWFNKLLPKNITGYNSYYVLLHPWVLLVESKRRIKWAWQRVFRGWDDRVTWSVDFYLARVIPEWLTVLKTSKQGIPVDMFQEGDWDEEECEYKPGTLEQAEQKYQSILDIIILGFQSYYKIEEEFFRKDSIEYDELYSKYKTGMDLFVKYFDSLWD